MSIYFITKMIRQLFTIHLCQTTISVSDMLFIYAYHQQITMFKELVKQEKLENLINAD